VSFLENAFHLRERGLHPRTEVISGITVYLTMSYIIVVNPIILSGAGVPQASAAAMTCLAAAIPTLLMGFWTNYPLALASGMGLNAFLAAEAARHGWQAMMGVIFIEGALVTALVLTGLREKVMNAIPMDLKRAIGVGIGLFIALLGMKSAGWMISSPDGFAVTTLPLNAFRHPATLLATAGTLLTAILYAWNVTGALLIGIAATTALTFALGYGGAIPAGSFVSLPDFSAFGQLDVGGALRLGLVPVIFAFLITDFFDTMGTLIAVGEQAGSVTETGEIPKLKRALLVDSLAACWGGICGASSVTTYIESASGVATGGRSGLTSVVTGLCFLASMFFTRLALLVPAYATAPALLIVGFLMISSIRDIDWGDATVGIPAMLTILVIPLTYSISRGIGFGFIACAVLKLATGKGREAPVTLYILAVIFAISFAMPGG
jgi:AGZA family xanthine/uracil permease-like MFS transporter